MKRLLEVLKSFFPQKKFLKNENLEISNVVMDSRKIEKNSLFFGINSGNNYCEKALEMGASIVIGDNIREDLNDPRIIRVENTVETMQKLANLYRKKLNLKVIGITGSNGKTTTKDLITGVLSEKYKTEKTQGNYNNHIGLPYTILSLDDNTEVAVLEMGMSSFGEIDLLCKIAQPDYGIITNIGDSHLEYLKTRENVFKAKGEMIPYIKKENLYVYGDDPFLKDVLGNKVGFSKVNDFVINDIIDHLEYTTFKVNNKEYKITLNGRHNCINGAMAVGLGKAFGLSEEEIKRGLLKGDITPMRFEKIQKGDILFINDAYNASPTSMSFSLETFGNLNIPKMKIAILGDMLELGERALEFHREIIEKAIGSNVDKIYLYGPLMSEVKKEFQNIKLRSFESKKDIISALKEEKGEKLVLLKGSRGMKLEEIIGQKEQV
ncbi:UDP-N-acetylmuramoyl-tripeptide--D-alanyl-D-alanine ligase [Cetobacterium ceti]